MSYRPLVSYIGVRTTGGGFNKWLSLSYKPRPGDGISSDCCGGASGGSSEKEGGCQ